MNKVDFVRNVLEEYAIERCCKCAVTFAIPTSLYKNVHDITPGTEFYCPNGHGQIYTTKSYEARIADLERQAIRLREERDTALKLRTDEASKRKRLEKRAKNGVCPCCKRSFAALAAHMKSKHPNFAEPIK